MDEEAIARLVEEKVRQALAARDLAEQRERLVWLLRARSHQLAEATRREDARWRAERAKADAAAKTWERDLEVARRRVLQLEGTRVGLWYVDSAIKWQIIVTALTLGCGLSGIVEPMLGHSVVAGYAVCPVACRDGEGPGRIATWTTNGNQEQGQLCDSPRHPIDHKVTSMDVEDPKNAPYRVSLWWNGLFNIFWIGLLLFLGWPLRRARQERARRQVERAALVELIAELEAKRPHAPPHESAYR